MWGIKVLNSVLWPIWLTFTEFIGENQIYLSNGITWTNGSCAKQNALLVDQIQIFAQALGPIANSPYNIYATVLLLYHLRYNQIHDNSNVLTKQKNKIKLQRDRHRGLLLFLLWHWS